MRKSGDPQGPHHNTPTPVAGVVLLVAISVLVGSITVVYLLEFGERSTAVAPITEAEFSYVSNASGVDDFGTELEPGQGLLEITITAGESARADHLFIQSDSFAQPRAWGASSRYGMGSEVAAGDTLRVAASRTDRISLIWRSAADEQSALLGTWDSSES